jgi:hypothetical protein
MGRRRFATNPITRVWTLLRFDLSDDECGFLLERGDVLVGDGKRVQAFRTREAALAWVRQLEPTVDAIPNGHFFDLRAVEAFSDRRQKVMPPSVLDVWSLLGEVARAANRKIPELAHAALPVGTGTGASLHEPLRVALACGLDVFRDVVTYNEPVNPFVAARAVTQQAERQ